MVESCCAAPHMNSHIIIIISLVLSHAVVAKVIISAFCAPILPQAVQYALLNIKVRQRLGSRSASTQGMPHVEAVIFGIGCSRTKTTDRMDLDTSASITSQHLQAGHSICMRRRRRSSARCSSSFQLSVTQSGASAS